MLMCFSDHHNHAVEIWDHVNLWFKFKTLKLTHSLTPPGTATVKHQTFSRHLKHQKTQQTHTPLPPKVSHHVLLLILLLQLCEISLDPGVAGQQVLGCIQNLFSLTAGQQQLVGTLPHSHLKVKLFLYAGVLHRPQIHGSQMIHYQYRQ